MKRFISVIKQIRLVDLFAPFVFMLMLIPSVIFRLINKAKHRKLWLVAEEGEARDNGYYFYKYVREKHPGDFCFYAVKPTSAGYEKVAKLGNIIKFGGIKHWLYYMSAGLNISSQKSGNPCPIFWYFLHVTLGLYRNRVFLQHGITKDDSSWLYCKNTKFKYLVCGIKPERDYILEHFGYKPENLILTGFPRWDSLMNMSSKYKSILIMPTWRNWLTIKDFKKSDYYRKWSGLIKNKQFLTFAEKNNIAVYFYPHINMKEFLPYFCVTSDVVKILQPSEDIQEYIRRCDLMITDYSSVAFDFAFLKKPILYYQFDFKKYRDNQLQEGYFNYKEDGFGKVIDIEPELVKGIIALAKQDLKNTRFYEKRVDKLFPENDYKNCERLYEAIK